MSSTLFVQCWEVLSLVSVPMRLWLDPPPVSTSTPLSRARIVEAALRILDAEQLSAVTMRRVAAELATGPASLYAHVANKDELHALMFDRIAGEIELPVPDPDVWMEQAKGIVRSMRDVMLSKPGIAAVAVAQIPLGPETLRVSEGLIGVLRAGGLSDQVIGYATDLLPLYATAIAQEAAVRDWGDPDEATAAEMLEELRGFFASLPADRFPNILSMVGALTEGNGDERFEFGLDILIGGLAAYGRPPSSAAQLGAQQATPSSEPM